MNIEQKREEYSALYSSALVSDGFSVRQAGQVDMDGLGGGVGGCKESGEGGGDGNVSRRQNWKSFDRVVWVIMCRSRDSLVTVPDIIRACIFSCV